MSDKKKYVLIHAYDAAYPERVLLVEKDRPAWQKGCLNLLGGKIEQGEEPLDTALRELKEESGLKLKSILQKNKQHEDVKLMGAIVSDVSIVYCVSLPVDSTKSLKPRKRETEESHWHTWNVVKNDKRLIPNLRVIIPMMRAEVSGWFVSGRGIAGNLYDISVRFMLDHPVPHKPEE